MLLHFPLRQPRLVRNLLDGPAMDVPELEELIGLRVGAPDGLAADMVGGHQHGGGPLGTSGGEPDNRNFVPSDSRTVSLVQRHDGGRPGVALDDGPRIVDDDRIVEASALRMAFCRPG